MVKRLLILTTLGCVCGTPVLAAPELPQGVWTGTFVRLEDPEFQTYPVVATMDGTEKGRIDFPSLGCSGELQFLGPNEEELQTKFYMLATMLQKEECGPHFALNFHRQGTAEYLLRTQGFSPFTPAGVLTKETGKRTQVLERLSLIRDIGFTYEALPWDWWTETLQMIISLDPPPAIPEAAWQGMEDLAAALTKGDFAAAESLGREVIVQAPWWAEAYYYYAIALEGMGKSGQVPPQGLEYYRLLTPAAPGVAVLQAEIRESVEDFQTRKRAAARAQEEHAAPIRAHVEKLEAEFKQIEQEDEQYEIQLAAYKAMCVADTSSESTYVRCRALYPELEEWREHIHALRRAYKKAGSFVDGELKAAYQAYTDGDYATALLKWRPLAEGGDSSAQNNLGNMYDEGEGVPEDNDEAVKWYLQAADQGHRRALRNLGHLYRYGDGVPVDLQEARKWYRKAVAAGNEDARKDLEELESGSR